MSSKIKLKELHARLGNLQAEQQFMNPDSGRHQVYTAEIQDTKDRIKKVKAGKGEDK